MGGQTKDSDCRNGMTPYHKCAECYYTVTPDGKLGALKDCVRE